MSKFRLSESQQQVLDRVGGGIAIVAGAGSGKTSTLVAKCEDIVARNPDARFLAISFTEKSARELEHRLAHLQFSENSSRHSIHTIHGFCARVIEEFPTEAGYLGGESILSAEEVDSFYREISSQFLWRSSSPPSQLDSLLREFAPAQIEKFLKFLSQYEAQGALETLRDSPRLVDQTLAALGVEWLARVRKSKWEAGFLEYHDLEVGAVRALKNSRVRSHYQRSFEVILVDEFQDTNGIQSALLEALSLPDHSNILIVGDPKQSIYRFRDADVELFEEWSEKLPVRIVLSENYRSRPEILHWINAYCGRLFQHYELSYEPLEPRRPSAEGAFPAVKILEGSETQHFADLLQQEFLSGRLELSSTVLLLKSVRRERKLLRALRLRGIPLLLETGEDFYQDPRVQELISALWAWLPLKDPMRALPFLRAPWNRVEDSAIHDWILSKERNTEAPWEMSLRTFPELQEAFHSLMNERSSVRPGEVLRALGDVAVLEEELGEAIESLWQVCEDLSAKGRTFSEIVRELDRRVFEPPRGRSVPPPPALGENQAVLRVMTIHASKGLEFPHVLLAGFQSKKLNSGRKDHDFLWNRDSGLSVKSSEFDENEFKRLKEAEKIEELKEEARLWYVAFTRAQETLTLLVQSKQLGDFRANSSSSIDSEKTDLGDHPYLWLSRQYFDLPPTPIVSWVPAFGEVEVLRTAFAPRDWLRPRERDFRWIRARHSVSEWVWMDRCELSYAFRLQETHEEGEETSEAPKIVKRWEDSRGEGAKELGTRLHGLLEHRDFEGLRKLQAEIPGRFLAAEVEAALRDLDGSSRGEVYSEWPFELAWKSDEVPVRLVGSIDFWGTSPLQLVDYKLTQAPKGFRELSELYRSQMLLYGAALFHALEESSLSETPSTLEASWLEISPKGVERYRFPLTSEECRGFLLELGRRVLEIEARYFRDQTLPIHGRLGAHCKLCEFRDRCPTYISSKH
jgi:ATP-dependent exoDNAse (exonuclease V) beta subunit